MQAQDTLPAITGSEKQVAWALDIRRALLAELETYETTEPDHQTIADDHPGFPVMHAAIETARQAATSRTEARWFIDNRDAYGLILGGVEPRDRFPVSVAMRAVEGTLQRRRAGAR